MTPDVSLPHPAPPIDDAAVPPRPLNADLRAARLAATPTPAEQAARDRRGGEVVTGISHAELAVRCNAILERRGEPATWHRETAVRFERKGHDPLASTLALVAEALRCRWVLERGRGVDDDDARG